MSESSSNMDTIGSQYTDNPVKVEGDQHTSLDYNHKEWDADMELALLNAIARCKPVGIHKHFRIISVQKQFNQNSSVSCSIKEIWQRLGKFYGMSALDELEEEDEEQEEEEREEEEKKKGELLNEFTLPLEDYEQLISEHRQDDQQSVSSMRDEESSQTSPQLPPAKRTRRTRDGSPANSVADSITSTPEPEEGKSSRRISRQRKSEATPERTTTGRRTGRSSSTATTNTVTRGSKRQTNKRK